MVILVPGCFSPERVERYQSLQSRECTVLQELTTQFSSCSRCIILTRGVEPPVPTPMPTPPLCPDSENNEFEELPHEREEPLPILNNQESVEDPLNSLPPFQSFFPSPLDQVKESASTVSDNSRTRRLHMVKSNRIEMDMGHRKRTAIPCNLPLPSSPLWPPHNVHYDDYWGGPARENLHAFEDPIYAFPLHDPLLSPICMKGPWTYF